MNELNKAALSQVAGGVDYYIHIDRDKGTIGVGFSIKF